MLTVALRYSDNIGEENSDTSLEHYKKDLITNARTYLIDFLDLLWLNECSRCNKEHFVQNRDTKNGPLVSCCFERHLLSFPPSFATFLLLFDYAHEIQITSLKVFLLIISVSLSIVGIGFCHSAHSDAN